MTPADPFRPMPKIPRLRREVVITEKIDGTNASVHVTEDGVFAASRNRWLTPESDNYGFAAWVRDHADELREGLGIGAHFGEWWGKGIQRNYGLTERRFSLFNAGRWDNTAFGRILPSCCSVVPVLHSGSFSDDAVDGALQELRGHGSHAAPGFDRPEGIVVFHTQSRQLYKVLLEGDELPKSLAGAA